MYVIIKFFVYGVRWCDYVFIDVAKLCVRVWGVYVFRGGLLELSLFLVVGMSNLEVVVVVGMSYIFLWMG